MKTPTVSTMSLGTAEGYLFDVPQVEPKEQTAAWHRQEFNRFMDLQRERGGLLTASQAALVLGVSRQRVQQLTNEGRFEVLEILDGRYLCGDQLMAYAAAEKMKGGRPSKLRLAFAGIVRS